jgi:hypothetical protein
MNTQKRTSKEQTKGPLMKQLSPLTALAGLLTILCTTAARAHEGHGLPGLSHWHGTDVWGFMAVAAIAATAIWLKGRK